MSEMSPLAEAAFLREAIDAMPSMVLIVDDDVRIHLLNSSASTGLGLRIEDIRHRRTGEVLHCIHAAFTREGCGRSEFCQDCVVRNCVILAMEGCRTCRRGISMVLTRDGQRLDAHLLVSASPFHWAGQRYAMLTLDNVSELIQLRHLLPICMHCKKIRDEHGTWHPVADYFTRHLDIDFSHGICPECLDLHYPNIGGQAKAKGEPAGK